MILLDEVMDKLRYELENLPTTKNADITITSEAELLKKPRKGSDSRLKEFILILSGLNPRNISKLEIHFTGNSSVINVKISADGRPLDVANQNKKFMLEKNPDFIVDFSSDNKYFRITVNSPEIDKAEPVDINAIIKNIGISSFDAWNLLEGFLKRNKNNLDILINRKEYSQHEQHRAAHSLKGAGKTLYAPFLANAARKVEKNIKNGVDCKEEIKYLESAWLQLEEWFKENRK
jgi:HPt (histidine-containing phosphotransfer) domain-containing protein